jgi:hypothetical protein
MNKIVIVILTYRHHKSIWAGIENAMCFLLGTDKPTTLSFK